MILETGTRLGPYEITSRLGAGGMGEVYRARDTRLDRVVAIKVLSPAAKTDSNFRARLVREARAISQLTHPHICTLHDIGEQDGTAFLVMELLDGQTLADRLLKGALPVDQAMTIAADVADALSAAHRIGIVHRDLKPANIMLTKAGAKLLDFGLAKWASPTIATGAVTDDETATKELTGTGTILGTLSYMAPEQIEGREADARSDIWALGAVMYEMVTGASPFRGTTPASTVGSILKDDVAPVSTRQPMVPSGLDRIVSTCLAKDPDQRWQSAADVRQQIRWLLSDASRATLPTASRVRGRRFGTWALWGPAGLAVALLLVDLTWRSRSGAPPADPVQLGFLPPPHTTFSSPPSSVVAPQIAVSPDGRQVAFVAQGDRGRPTLWVRALGAADAQPLRGTDDALYPFWSPDGRSVGFFAQGKLKTIDLSGGPARTLADASMDSRGGTWAADGTIVFSNGENSVLFRISATADRATPTPVTRLDTSRGETSHRFPSFLPDGRHFLYATRSPRHDQWGVSVGTLDSPTGKPVLERAEWSAQFAAPGHILFLRDGTLLAQPFDLASLSVAGDAVALATDVGGTTTGYAAFSASRTGVVIHASHIGIPGQLRWFDRLGKSGNAVGTPAEYLDLDLSPDEQTVAVSRVGDPGLTAADVWLIDLSRNIATRFTNDPTNDASALWSPDGSRIAFRSNRQGYTKVFEKRRGGTEPEHAALDTGVSVIPSDWSADGRTILYTTTSASSGFEVWQWQIEGGGKPQRVVHTAQNAMHGRLSPDGHWLAYASDESGELQVYVAPFPAMSDKRQISSTGGAEPRWRRDGLKLFYLATAGKLMSVEIPHGNPLDAAAPRDLFDVRVPLSGNPYRTNYAVSADGQRFLVNTRAEDSAPPINVILNWTALLRK